MIEIFLDNIPGVIAVSLTLLCFWGLVKQPLSKVKKVKAQLVEKYVYDVVSRTNPNAKRYTLVFETEKGKRLSFDVSEFSYGGYKVKKRGTLKYKGNMILEFK